MRASTSFVLWACSFVGGLVVASTAHAHLHLVSPSARDGGEELKDGPCGEVGSVRGAATTFEAGQTIEIVIDEYIDHPSHYRVAFDVDGDDDFADPVCVENCETNGGADPVFAPGDPAIVLLDHVVDEGTREQRFSVTLPDVVCDRCTLQVIQVMYDKRPYTIGGNDNYYQCADLVLVPRAGVDGGIEPSDGGVEPSDAGGGARDAGPRDAGARDAGPHDHHHDDDAVSGGCSCRTSAESARGLVPFVLAFFVWRRRPGEPERRRR